MKPFTLPTIFTAVDKFSSKVVGMGKSLDAFTSKASKTQRKLDSTFAGLGGNVVAGGVVVGMGLAGLAVKKFIDEASKIENAEAFFTPVLGSAKKAATLVEMLNKEAAVTPFRFEDLSHVASSLLPLMDGDLNKVMSTFRLLGDTAGGSVDKLNRITLGYTKALLKGKITLESLNIIAEAGVPIFSELAKTMNLGAGAKGTGKLFAMIRKGQVPVEMLTKTFEKMGAQGGLFYKGMITASETFSGITSTLEDNVSMTAAAIGKEMLPYMKTFALKAIEITGKIREWVSQNKELIATKVKAFMEGVVDVATKLYKAAEWVYRNWERIVFWTKVYIAVLVGLKVASMIMGAITVATQLLTVATWLFNGAVLVVEGAIWLWTAAQWALNAAMLANPIGIIIVAIAALIAIVYLSIKYWDSWGESFTNALSTMMPGLGLLIHMIKQIKDGFSKEGFIGAIKGIGRGIADFILSPLSDIASIIAKITGADWAASMANGIESFRADLGIIDPAASAGVASSAAEEDQQVRAQVMQNITQTQNTTLTIKNQTANKINTESDNNLINIKMPSTMRFGY
jgi:tape measure domain-containing protein